MPTPLFYDHPIALNSQTHRNLKLKHSDDRLKFSARTNAVVLAGVEFPEACKHFPIVFAKSTGEQVLPMAVLGFRDQENLFVDADGRWKSEYVPAYIRRYPFIMAKSGTDKNMTVCIDESYPGFGADEGLPLFNDKGEPTDFLKGTLTFLEDYQKQVDRTDIFLKTLREFDLLTDVSANINLADGQKYSLAGLRMVDERKLQALPDEKAMRLFRSGELAWIYSHLFSISNFNRLLGKARPAQDSATPAPASRAAPSRKSPDQARPPAKK